MQYVSKPNIVQIPFDIVAVMFCYYFNKWYLLAWIGSPILPTVITESLYMVMPHWDIPSLVIIHDSPIG